MDPALSKVGLGLAKHGLRELWKPSNLDRLIARVQAHPDVPPIDRRARNRLIRLVQTESAINALIDQDANSSSTLSSMIANEVLVGRPVAESEALANVLITEFLGTLTTPEAFNLIAYSLRQLKASSSEQYRDLLTSLDASAGDGTRAVPNAYALFVADLVPDGGLCDRDDELAALEAFCRGSRAYGWWQGDAWAGKTALMASFVLRPSSEYSVISCFVSRRSGRNSHTHFTDTLLGQLCDLTGETPPPAPSESLRHEQLRRLLLLACTREGNAGRKLVLLVDGLDEDAAFGRPDTPSIASLLPSRPPDALRIIVAGRPATPVPPGHPLTTCEVVNVAPSAHATAIRDRAREELAEFLHSGGLREDLVGFLVAAQGGLTAADLGELAGVPPYRIDSVLHAARIVKLEVNRSDTRHGPLHVLGHDDLVTAGADALGRSRITDYWQRIKAWADSYCQSRWPANTPEYLLRGYAKRLIDRGDRTGFIALVLDLDRHNRMRQITGGDADAMTETRSARQLLTPVEASEVVTAFLIEWRYDALVIRSSMVPEELPALWWALGHPHRAEALALSLLKLGFPSATGLLAGAVARSGRKSTAMALAESIRRPGSKVDALVAVAVGVTVAEGGVAGHQLASSMTGATLPDAALSAVAAACAADGDTSTAVEIARSITSRPSYHTGLALVAAAAARVKPGPDLIDVVGLIHDPLERVKTMAIVSEVFADRGDFVEAHTWASAADAALDGVEWILDRFVVSIDVARAFGRAGHNDSATAVAARIKKQSSRKRALANAAEALAKFGDLEKARAMARTAEAEPCGDDVLEVLARAYARCGDTDAMRIALDAIKPRRAIVYARAVSALIEAGDIATATLTAEHAVSIFADPADKAAIVTPIANMYAARGDQAAVLREVSSISDTRTEAFVLTQVAESAFARGDEQTARACCDAVESVILSTHSPRVSGSLLVSIASALLTAGDEPGARYFALEAARLKSAAGDDALGVAAGLLLRLGVENAAIEAAASITETQTRDAAFAELADIRLAHGHYSSAMSMASLIETSDLQTTALRSIVHLRIAATGSAFDPDLVAGAATADVADLALTEAALRFAELDDVASARAAAVETSTLEHRAWALALVAKTLVDARNDRAASEFAAESLSAAQGLDTDDCAWTLVAVGSLLARTGYLTSAAALLERVTDHDAFVEIAAAVATEAFLNEDESTYADYSIFLDDADRVRIAARVAPRDSDRAQRLLTDSFSDERDRVRALSETAQRLGDAGEPGTAERFAAAAHTAALRVLAGTESTWDNVWPDVARAHLACGNLRAARDIAETLVSEFDRVLLLRPLCLALAETGDVVGVKEMAAEVSDAHQRCVVIAETVEILLTAGQIAAADSVVDLIYDVDDTDSWFEQPNDRLVVAIAGEPGLDHRLRHLLDGGRTSWPSCLKAAERLVDRGAVDLAATAITSAWMAGAPCFAPLRTLARVHADAISEIALLVLDDLDDGAIS